MPATPPLSLGVRPLQTGRERIVTMNYSVLPPEINSARMYAGLGSGPMLAAASAWDGLAAELGSAAASFEALTSGLAGGSWQGPASIAMTAAAAPNVKWLSAAAAQAQSAAAQAQTAASVFESARAAIVHPAMIVANRIETSTLAATNLLGPNTPAIAAAEAAYEQMWAQDVTAMVGYHGGASAVASQLASWADRINLGLGNLGILNLGSGNTGNLNVLGNGNHGSFNLFGSANTGNDNVGFRWQLRAT
jgi:PPE-repeat protein